MIYVDYLTLIDFGLSTFYEKKLNEEKAGSFVGNLMYASPNVHNLKEVKAIDDIISVSYVYMYMCFDGNLLWSIDETSSNLIYNLKKIENIEIHLLSNDKVDKKFLNFLNKLYEDIVCYEL